MKERKRFLLYYDWENLIQDMSDTDIASITRGIFKYQNTGEVLDMTYGAKLAFSFMRPVFDEDRKDWEGIKKINSDNAKKRWDKNRSEPMRPHTTAYDPLRASTDSVSGIGNGNEIETGAVENISIVEEHLKTLDSRTTRYCFYSSLIKNIYLIQFNIDTKQIDSIEKKLLEFRTKLGDDNSKLELENFWEHHSSKQTQMKSLIFHLNTWLKYSITK